MIFAADDGYPGLLEGKKAVVIYTSAVYGPGRGKAFGNDFLTPYFEDWLRWTGIDDITGIHFQPNLATADPEPARRAAHVAAERAARDSSQDVAA